MAVKTVVTPPPQLTSITSVKTGSHTHQCSKYNHVWDCQYSTKCALERISSAQKIIDDMCPACHMLAYGAYAS